MSRDIKQKQNKNRPTSRMQQKLAALFIIVLLALAFLSYKIYSISRDNGDAYKKRVYSQQNYSNKTLKYKRGEIIDRKGSKLAYSEKVHTLFIDSKQILDDEGKYVEATMTALQKCFPQVNINEVRNYLDQHPESRYKIMAKQISHEDYLAYEDYVEKIKENAEAYKKKSADERANEQEPIVPIGIGFEDDYKRIYPYNNLASDVIGFKTEETSSFGLEAFYNSVLNGTNGRQYGYLNEDSVVERTIKPATDGNSIVTTIDANIQSIVEKHLKIFYDEHTNEARDGGGANNLGCIIMDPNSGEVLAMASYPTFNLNDPSDLTPFYSQEEINAMDDDEKKEAKNQIWRNFCISDTYEPGSTAKPFTVSAALEEAAITGNESYNCNGSLELGEHKIHCHNRLGDGLLTVSQGIQKSCNVVLMDVAFALGREKWLKYNRLFNFGLKTNIDLAGEVNAKALVFDDKMGQTDLAIGSFGQGFNVTMIQMACAYCALINGGYYYEPHVVSKIVNAEGATVTDIEPRILRQVISGTTSDRIKEMMRSVVMEGDEGTGWTARPAGYTMGGKTGTAEKIPRDKKNYLVSFMGYVPADDPEVLIYVVVDQPNAQSQDNARYATFLTKDIMTEVLPYMNIFMTEELTEKEKAELEEQQMSFAIVDPVSANSISENEIEEEEALPEGNAGNTDVQEESQPREIQYDEETGYPIDPNTGDILDPETLLPISGSTSFME